MLWLGKTNEKGYGYIRDGDEMRRVHRVAYEHYCGELPADRPDVCHVCDTPNCWEPTHLFACTALMNATDRDAKGRNGRRKLTAEQVCEIREFGPRLGCRELGRFYGVDHKTISDAISGTNWQGLDCKALPKAA